MIYQIYFKIFLIATILFLSSILCIFYLKKLDKRYIPQIKNWQVAALLTILFLIRFLYMEDAEANVDTSTWLSSMIAINHYPSWLWTLLNYTDSRPLTVLPLVIASWFGIPIGYIASECIGLFFMLGSVFLLYKIFSFYLKKTASIVITWSFGLFIATTFSTDYIAYNSEQFSVFMLTVSVYGYLSYLKNRWDNSILSLIIGVVLGSLLYIKFQNVPMGMLVAIMLGIEFFKRQAWKNLTMLALGGILPTLLVNIYYFAHEELMTFWNNYFWNYFYYSYTTQFVDVPMSRRFSPSNISEFIYADQGAKSYFLAISILIAVAFLINLKSLFSSKNKQVTTLTFSFIFILVSLYAILQSGTAFEHYKIFMLVPLTLFFGILISFSSAIQQKILISVFLLTCMVQAIWNLGTKEKSYPEPFLRTDDKVINVIKSYTTENDPIVIWGWSDRLYVRANRPMGYRDSHSFHFSLKSALLPTWTKDFIYDMETNKSMIFIDSMIPYYSTFGQYFLSHDKVPAIKQYIDAHYTLIKTIDKVRIYKRK